MITAVEGCANHVTCYNKMNPVMSSNLTDFISQDGRDYVTALKGKSIPITAQTIKWPNGSQTALPWMGVTLKNVSRNTCSDRC